MFAKNYKREWMHRTEYDDRAFTHACNDVIDQAFAVVFREYDSLAVIVMVFVMFVIIIMTIMIIS